MGKVTTRQMKAYIERKREKQIENAIAMSNNDFIKKTAKEILEAQIKALAENIVSAYNYTDKRWFVYVSKQSGMSVNDGVYTLSVKHFLLTFSSEEEFKKALTKIKKNPMCRPLYGGEITPELIDKIKGALS